MLQTERLKISLADKEQRRFIEGRCRSRIPATIKHRQFRYGAVWTLDRQHLFSTIGRAFEDAYPAILNDPQSRASLAFGKNDLASVEMAYNGSRSDVVQLIRIQFGKEARFLESRELASGGIGHHREIILARSSRYRILHESGPALIRVSLRGTIGQMDKEQPTFRSVKHKPRRLVVLQHAKSEGLGTIENALRSAGLEFQCVRTFAGEAVPAAPGTYSGLIVMGGPMGVYETDRYPGLIQEMRLIESFLKGKLPIFGVCLGSQLLAVALGATVRKGDRKEIGWYPVRLTQQGSEDPLWLGEPCEFTAYHWHGDVFDLPVGAVRLASSEATAVQAYRFAERAYGVLFHLEVTTDHIHKMLTEFSNEI